MSVDPLGETYSKWTPYAFAGNQVVHSRELEGLEPYNDLDRDEREDYNSENHGPGFGDAMTDQDHYQDAFPMGGELNEVVVGGLRDFDSSDESYGYDDGRYEGQEGNDYDSDGYGGKDDYDFELTHEDLKILGVTIIAIGGLLTATGIAAEIGIPLLEFGDNLLIADTIDDDGTKLLNGELSMTEAVEDFTLTFIPVGYESEFGKEGFDYLYLELGAAVTDYWFEMMNELHP